MPVLAEIKNSIKNVRGTQKITKAMYLISVSKSKAARVKLEKTRGYFYQIAATLSEIIAETENLDTWFIDKPGDKHDGKKLFVVLSGDKGQAGSYNHNIIDLLDKHVDKKNDILWVAGFTGKNAIIHKGYNVSPDFRYPVSNPDLFRAREIAEKIVEEYLSGGHHYIYLVYTDMITPLRLEPTYVQLLPLKPEDFTNKTPEVNPYDKAVYEPSPRAVFDHLAPRYLKGVIYGAFVDSFTSEQHARMFAMDNATKNADEMINDLTLLFNRTRQAKITQEINEIVAGNPTEQ